jgi:hypothetical protein
MPLAVTHVILSIIAADLYRDYVTKHKRYFTLWTILVAGIAGLAPDLDHPIRAGLLALGIDVPLLAHGMALHTPAFGLVFLIPFAACWAMKKHKLAVIFAVITFGILFHLFLDWLIGGGDVRGIMLGFPFSYEQFKGPFLGLVFNFPMREALDAAILLVWLVHEEKRHKIRDFI